MPHRSRKLASDGILFGLVQLWWSPHHIQTPSSALGLTTCSRPFCTRPSTTSSMPTQGQSWPGIDFRLPDGRLAGHSCTMRADAFLGYSGASVVRTTTPNPRLDSPLSAMKIHRGGRACRSIDSTTTGLLEPTGRS